MNKNLRSVPLEGSRDIETARRKPHTIYLDFDGCLHDLSVWLPRTGEPYCDTPGRTLFEWAPILTELLDPYPDIRIILSTSWTRLGFETARDKLPMGLRQRVFSATLQAVSGAYGGLQHMRRGEQVRVDAMRRGLARWEWFAIDDDGNGWADVEDRLVRCRGGFGLSDSAVQARIRYLLDGN